jgi:hypothetical protein
VNQFYRREPRTNIWPDIGPWSADRAGKIGSPVMRFIINRVPPAGGTSAPSVPIYASAAYGCALAHSPQTTREVRATFYSRFSQYGPHAAPCTFGREGPCPHGPGGGPPTLHARFPSVSTAGDSIYQIIVINDDIPLIDGRVGPCGSCVVEGREGAERKETNTIWF